MTLLSSSTDGFHVLYCMDMGIKPVIASNNCTNSDAGVHNSISMMQLKVDVAALC